MFDYNNIIISPILTEKTNLQREFGKHYFKVSRNASKSLIKKSIESIFNVSVVKCNIINVKKKRNSGRFRNFANNKIFSFKKAIVSLKEGDVFDFYGGI